MKKYMIADLVKAIEDERNQEISDHMSDHGGISYDESKYLLNNYNEADHDQVILCAESLGIAITDVEDDDVENWLEMGGKAKGELESSVGPIQWIYDNKAKVYIVYMIVTTMGKPRDIIYNIEPSIMKEWTDSESMGEYWNNKIRSNQDIENAASSSDFPIGGCNDNLLDPSIVSRFNTRFVAIS